MVFCSKCGAELPDHAIFCLTCGARVKTDMGESEEFKVSGRDLEDKIGALLHEGNVRRIIIKDEKGRTLMELPLTVGVIGTVLAPVLAAVGALAALAMNYTIEVIRKT